MRVYLYTMQAFYFNDFKNTYMPEILKEIYREKVYDPYIKKDSVIVDFGANLGLWTYFASDFAKKLYSVEPTEAHFKCLTKMIDQNNLKNVIPLKMAISHENGKAEFYHSENSTMNSLMSEVSNKNEKETVKTITLDKFMSDNKIKYLDFVKVDIEGAEAKVFGCDSFDKVKDKIGTIMGEFHSWTGINPNQFATYFTDRGFKFRWLNQTDASLFIAQKI